MTDMSASGAWDKPVGQWSSLSARLRAAILTNSKWRPTGPGGTARYNGAGAAEISSMRNGGIIRGNWLEPPGEVPWPPAMRSPFRYFNSSPEVIRLAVMMYILYPLSLAVL